MERKLLLLIFTFSLNCKIENASTRLWGSKTDDTTVLVADGVPLVSIPYDSMTENEKFLQKAAKFTDIQISSPLDTCQHKVVMKIRTSCSDMSEEELAKLGVNLLNCQLAVEGRKMFPCIEDMSLKQCTIDMDADMWNAYHIMSNKARAVCYAARNTQFRALTVNKLMQSAHSQIEELDSLKQSQDRLEEQTTEALLSLNKGNKVLLEQQEYLKVAQATAHKRISAAECSCTWRLYVCVGPLMPRVSGVSVNEAVAALEMFSDTLLKDRNLPAYTSKVWQDISNCLKNKWNAHNVYINVRENRRGILTQMKLNLKIEDNKLEKCNDTTSSLDITEESTNTTLDTTKENHDLSTFNLYITYELWTEMKAGYIEYKDKTYGCLKPGVWSDIISDEFWRQFRLPCAYVFKRAKVFFSDKRSHFIIINGKCKSKACGSSFTAYADTEPKRGEHLIMRCLTKDTSTISHEKVKRQLRFQKRQIVGKDLLVEGVSNWRRRLAMQEMKIGDIEPPLLYESSTLRKVKQEYHDRTLDVGPKDGKDPIYTLRKMKHTSPYCGSIHEITLDKVCVHYRTPTQMHVYREYCRKKTYRRIAMDATGSFVSKIQITDGLQSGHIFLYVIVVNIDGLIIPVHQMISEKHDTNTIEYWIKEWLRMGATKPEEAISDYSRALLGAMTSAFNRMTIKEYVSSCFSAINNHNTQIFEISRPADTYIRVDVAHLVKFVCRWKCFDKKHLDIKTFFVRCVALMISCQSFQKFESILLLTLTVSIQQYEGYYSTGLPSPAEEAKKELENYIATEIHHTNLDIDHIEEITDRREENDIMDTNNKEDNYRDEIHRWIEKLKTQAEINSDKKASRLNAFYLPEFYKQITRLCLEFPLWSGVLAPIFNSEHVRATSAHCEAYFKDLREYIFKNVQTPMRADKFIKMHLRSIDGTMKIASGAIVTSNMDDTNNNVMSINRNDNYMNTNHMDSNINKEIDKNQDMHQFENWMNKGKTEIHSLQNEETNENNKLSEHTTKSPKSLTNTKSKYFKPYPEIKHIKNRTSKKSTKKFFLRNGSFLQPLKINGTTYEIRNTCPFDSIAQIITLIALEDENYFNHISNSNNKFLKFCLLILNIGVNTIVYKERIALLLDHDKLKLPTMKAANVHIIDAYDNIAVMWRNLTKDEPCVNKISECSSHECQKEIHNISVLGVNHKLIQEKGFMCLEEAFHYNFQVKNVKCQRSECPGRRTEYAELKLHLYIELDIRASLDAKTGMTCQLNDFPVTINILKQEYRLAGVIEHTTRHYIAYARRIHGTWSIYNDLMNSVQCCKQKHVIEPHGAIYIYNKFAK